MEYKSQHWAIIGSDRESETLLKWIFQDTLFVILTILRYGIDSQQSIEQ